MNILITGCNGFIGKHLTNALINKGYKVKGIDLFHEQSFSSKYECIIGDILDKDAIQKAVQGCDLIINLAAKHHDFGISQEEYFSVNDGGIKSILNAAAKEGIKKVIFLSSVVVYGKNEADEDTPPAPANDYGRSKLAAEESVKKWTDEDKSRSVIIIRPPVVFGINNFANMYNLIDKIIRKKFFWIGKGSNIKSVTYVDNLVAAIIFLLEGMNHGCEIYNYADEPHMTTKQIVDTISKYGNVTIPKIRVPLLVAEIGGKIMDIASKLTKINFSITGARIKKFNIKTCFKAEKIRGKGFSQPVPLEEGFRKTVEWYLKQIKK